MIIGIMDKFCFVTTCDSCCISGFVNEALCGDGGGGGWMMIVLLVLICRGMDNTYLFWELWVNRLTVVERIVVKKQM